MCSNATAEEEEAEEEESSLEGTSGDMEDAADELYNPDEDRGSLASSSSESEEETSGDEEEEAQQAGKGKHSKKPQPQPPATLLRKPRIHCSKSYEDNRTSVDVSGKPCPNACL
jgi:hypothetical protein